jgi:hypothetical protein
MYSNGVHNWQRNRAIAFHTAILLPENIAPIVEATQPAFIQSEATGSYDPDRYIDIAELTDIELY